LFAYVLCARGAFRVLALGSYPAVLALQGVQWAPLLTVGALVPWLGGVLACKPSIGVALACYRPTPQWLRGAVGGAAALSVAAFVLAPSWPSGWLAAVRESTAVYSAPVVLPGGWLLLFALARWRLPEARLLVALSCVPQTVLGYELLPVVALVPANTFGVLALTLASHAAPQIVGATITSTAYNDVVLAQGRATVWCVLVPALGLVLRRSNVGPAPGWLERALARARVPGWLRGRPAADAPTPALAPIAGNARG
jgi:hypothetical protein